MRKRALKLVQCRASGGVVSADSNREPGEHEIELRSTFLEFLHFYTMPFNY